MATFTREPSEEARLLVERLWRPASGLFGLVRNRRDRLDALLRLKTLGEPAAIPSLFPLIADPSSAVRRAAADVIAQLLRLVPTSELAWLDERMRDGYHSGRWLSPDLTACRQHDAAADLICLASFHSNGHVRESAVKALAARTDGFEVPFLLLRRNDWVRQVRKHAESALEARLRPELARSWASSLTLVVRLRACGRADHDEFVGRVFDLLRRPECVPAVLELLQSEDRMIRRTACRFAIDAGGRALSAAIELASRGEDPVLRLWLARAALDRTEEAEELEQVLRRMAGDPFLPIRVLAIEARVNRAPSTAKESIERGLVDLAGSVRGTCQYHARELLRLDVADYYRRLLAATDGSGVTGALLGLAETGGAADAATFEEWAHDARNGVRAAAIRGLALHGTPASVETLWANLEDRSDKVRRHAAAGLLRLATPMPADRLTAFLRDPENEEARKTALRMVRGLPRQQQLIALLITLPAADKGLDQLVRLELSRWLFQSNRGQITFGKEQVKHALRALDACRGHITETFDREVRFLLKAAER